MKRESEHQEKFKKLFDESIEDIRKHAFYQLQNEPLANDLVQEAYLTIWEKREQIEWATAKGLLYRIVGNLVKNHFKHQKVKRKHQEISFSSVEKETPEFKMEQNEFKALLEGCIAQLPEGSRTAFLMNRIDSFKYRQIAEQLSISVKAVEKRMSIAIQLLTVCVGQKL